MDPTTKLDPVAASLIEKYVNPVKGALDVGRALGQGVGTQIGSGLAGIGSAVRHLSMDKGADAVAQFQKDHAPDPLSPEGIKAIQAIAPTFYSVANSKLGQGAADLGNTYNDAVNKVAHVGSVLSPELGAGIYAAGTAAPNAAFPEGAEGEAAIKAGASALKDVAPAAGREASPVLGALPTAPLLEDGANARTLAREQAANARRAQDGLTTGEVPTSDFAGRQAEHEGAVAARMNEKTPRQISSMPGYASHLSGTVPDDATVYTATHPETGDILGHATTIKRGGAHQLADIQVNPDYQRQGIGSDLFGRAVSGAHDEGLPLHGDTSVTPEQMANVAHSGHTVEMNPSVVEDSDFRGNPVLKSGNGQPVYKIHPPTEVDDATEDDPVQGSWIASQAYADGGGAEAGPIVGGLADLVHQYAPLKGMPVKAHLPGVGTLDVGPNFAARKAAADYAKESGIPNRSPSTYARVDPAKATAIAQAFDAMPHNPSDPATAASYQALIDETKAQYQHMKKAGVNVEFMPPGKDPYAQSPRLMAEDVAQNNHMYVYPTSEGFGSGDITDNPLLGDSGETFGGVPATHNDLFRAVHDYFGHAKEGVGFRANGEENAWRQHAGMYSDAARPAMTTETRGQNSYVNFGPNGPKNQLASAADTQYAPQKIGLLPDEFNQLDDPEMHFLHMSNLSTPDATLDPKYYGTGIKGAEARRGGTKTTSLYPADIDPKDIEQGLQGKTPYRVSVPASKMYDMNADPEGLRANAPSFSDAEDAVKDAGYAGYHVPDAQGILRGQGRLFGPTAAQRLGPGADPIVDEDLASGFADGGTVGYADGGEAGAVAGGLSDLIKQYAPEAETLAKKVASDGSATYNPTTGDLLNSGYILPNHATRSAALDSAPDAGQIHDFLMTHQDAFDEDPSAVFHIHSDDDGNHFMHAAHYTPDSGDAADKTATAGLPGYQNIGTGEIHPPAALTNPAAPDIDPLSPHEQDVADYLRPPMTSTPWTPGQQTVNSAKRNAFPGIYNDPRQVIADAASKVGPEDPLMQQLFGVSRRDLSDLSLSRQGN